ncbi:hypothetical protein PIB30_081060 [Stylosanthes scabra]|uniref:Uncharacterized protein n=1 Tax=Stylosanthes scabra TaxID=79078 RepID=A0ABU6VRR8_9FABA|nr:hypothetical protein [Stylosanthes scabra]
MDCAWMLDGATKDRVHTLSLASRYGRDGNRNGWIEPEGRDDERNEIVMVDENEGILLMLTIEMGLESTPHSKFLEPPKIESIRRITEPIRFHPVFKFNVQNALRIDSSSYESILKRRNMISKGFQRLIGDEWSGYISLSAVGSLFPRGIKANVAAHGGYRGAFGSGPGYQIRF